MDPLDMAYQDKVLLRSGDLAAMRGSKGTIRVPYTEEPDVEVGDSIIFVTGSKELAFTVTDIKCQKNGTLELGTDHPHMLTLTVESATAARRVGGNTINIGSVTGHQVQVGDQNSMAVTLHVHELVEKVAQSGDADAKSKFVALLENKTVAAILGAGTTALVGALGSGR